MNHIAKCGCGRAFTAREWDALGNRIMQPTGVGNCKIELRQCPCRSHLALATTDLATIEREYNESLQLAAEYAAAERLAS